ncbi:MAG: cadmium-translocating P-type ATPase [Rhodospirillaceae bacterium]|jgi:P-type Cu2+ transporter|nr:cadmium-translocating P-type ATPase [Rhodospirillaceae bacterium]
MTNPNPSRSSSDVQHDPGPHEARNHAYRAYVEAPPGQPATLSLLIENLHCPSCIRQIETAFDGVSDMVEARVNLTTRRLRLRWQGDGDRADDLVRRVTDLGFSVAPFHPRDISTTSDREGRYLLRCLAVAGFAAANVMLLSVAVWAGLASDMGPATRSLLQWVSGLIALPAVVYAGRPFFKSAWSGLTNRSLNMDVPISVAVLLTATMSLFEVAQGGLHTYFDACVALLFILLIGRYLDHLARARARGAVERLSILGSTVAQMIGEDGRLCPIQARDLPIGAEVMVPMGGRIPADGLVVRGASDIDSSLVTGESTPRPIGPGEDVFAGTLNMSAAITLRVTASADQTILADIVRLMEAAQQKRSRYVRLADRAAKLYAPIVHIAALLTFMGWLTLGDAGWQPALVIAIAVLLITCPCALGLAVPVVQIVACGRLMEDGILVTRGDALERLAVADTIVFDKTGTLTFGRLALTNKAAIDLSDGRLAASIAAASHHPLCRALIETYGPVVARTGVVEEPGFGLRVGIDKSEIRLGSRQWCGVREEGDIEQGLLGPELWLAQPDRPPVQFLFEDVLRPDAVSTIRTLRGLGFRVELLSGDREPAVRYVAEQVGIDDWQASCTPADKAARLAALEAAGERVLMVGDGLNDAPALAGAFVSMSPASAADVSRTSADVIIQGERLAPIATAIRLARKSRTLVFQNFSLAALYNIVAIPFAVAGYVTPLIAAIAMSASSIAVTLNALRLRTGGRRRPG